MTSLGHAELAREQPAHQHLAERAGAAGDDDALTVEQGPASVRVVVGGRGELRHHLRPARRPRSRSPRGSGCESRLRSITTESSGSISTSSSKASRSMHEQVVLGDRLGAHVPQAVQRRDGARHVGDRAGENRCRRAAEHSPREASHRAARLTQEPLEQAMARRQLAADHRCPDRQGPGCRGLAEQLRAAVRVDRVGQVALHVAAASSRRRRSRWRRGSGGHPARGTRRPAGAGRGR